MVIARNELACLAPESAFHADAAASFELRLAWHAKPFLVARGFSAMERALVMGILMGRTNKEIGAGRKLTENTIESYLKVSGGHLGRCPRKTLHRDFLVYLLDRLDAHEPR